MSQLSSPPPSFSMAEMETIADEYFAIQGQAKPLDSDRDQNARLKTNDGDYVLKVYNKDQDKDLVILENDILTHVSVTAPHLKIPKVFAMKNGALLGDKDGHVIRLLSFLPGKLYVEAEKTPELLTSFGTFMGEFSKAMESFPKEKICDAAKREGHNWNLNNALLNRQYQDDIVDDENRAIVNRAFDRYETHTLPRLDGLRFAMLHQDANDYNIVVGDDGLVACLFDFGDVTYGHQINELAIMLQYALMDQPQVLVSARTVIQNYTKEFPLTEDELDVLFDLVKMRLCTSVSISSHRVKIFPENEYLLSSQKPSFDLLQKLDQINPVMLSAVARKAGGFDGIKGAGDVASWLGERTEKFHNLFPFSMLETKHFTLSIKKGAAGADLVHDPKLHWDWIRSEFASRGAKYSIGLYGEDRDVYDSDQFAEGPVGERRSVHLGLDFFLEADTPVFAPMDGRVVSVKENTDPLDYGPTVVLAHKAGDANDENSPEFFTLYGHLSRKTLEIIKPGQTVKAGDTIAYLGEDDVNGGWAPHLHFQIMTSLLCDEADFEGNFNGACEPHLWDVWQDICLDPNLMIGLASKCFEVSA